MYIKHLVQKNKAITKQKLDRFMVDREWVPSYRGDNISTPFLWICIKCNIQIRTYPVVCSHCMVLCINSSKTKSMHIPVSTYLQQPATVDKVCHSLGRDSWSLCRTQYNAMEKALGNLIETKVAPLQSSSGHSVTKLLKIFGQHKMSIQ